MRRAVLLLVFLIGAAILSPAQVLTTLYSFCSVSNCADGAIPYAGLLNGSDGNFYGTTYYGGASDSGTIFKITPAGKLTGLYSFCSQQNCVDGANPYGPLVQGTDGNLYGTTSDGGANAQGTVFKVTTAGSLTTLYSFCRASNCSDGAGPLAGLVQATDGNFYGTTSYGGTYGLGSVFKITPNGVLTTLHSLNGTDGNEPASGVIQAKDGNFYGTAFAGGAYSDGVVFRVSSGGTYSLLHSFSGSDGSYPLYGLVQGGDGKLYGTTLGYGTGSVFSITLDGVLNELHRFNGGDGSGPSGNLLQAKDGYLFGLTFSGGAYNDGTVYRIGADGAFTSLHSFGGSDGSTPYGALVQDTDGIFYGTTGYGGSGHPANGSIFTLAFSPALLSVTSFGTGLVSSTDGHILCGTACSYTYNDAQQVALSAVPAPGYTFSGWTGCDNSNGTYCYLTMSSDRNVTVEFLPSTIPFVSLSFKPSYVKGGQLSAGTLTLAGTTGEGGLTVALTSDHPGIAHPPSFVFVPPNKSSVQFAVNTFPVKTNTTVTITASGGVYQVSGTLTVGTVPLPSSIK